MITKAGSRRLRRREFGVWLAAAGGAALASGFGGAACEGTGGTHVTLRTVVRGGAARVSGFTTSLGWTVALERALVGLGPLYYYEGAPVARLLPTWLGVRSAHAHPGHYKEGDVLGEMPTPTSVDLFEERSDLGGALGVTGVALSASLAFPDPAVGPHRADLGASAVVLEGVATKSGASVPFLARAAPADLLDADGKAVVLGIPFANGGIEGDGTVELVIDTSVWLDQLDFSLLSVPSNGDPAEPAPGSVPHNAFTRGIKKAVAYGFSYTPA